MLLQNRRNRRLDGRNVYINMQLHNDQYKWIYRWYRQYSLCTNPIGLINHKVMVYGWIGKDTFFPFFSFFSTHLFSITTTYYRRYDTWALCLYLKIEDENGTKHGFIYCATPRFDNKSEQTPGWHSVLYISSANHRQSAQLTYQTLPLWNFWRCLRSLVLETRHWRCLHEQNFDTIDHHHQSINRSIDHHLIIIQGHVASCRWLHTASIPAFKRISACDSHLHSFISTCWVDLLTATS